MTTASSSPTEHYTNGNKCRDYRSALALNNMATTLLQRGCHEDAFRTYRDSLRLIQMNFASSTIHHHHHHHHRRSTSTTQDAAEDAAPMTASAAPQHYDAHEARTTTTTEKSSSLSLFAEASKRYTQALSSTTTGTTTTSNVSTKRGMHYCEELPLPEVHPVEDDDFDSVLAAAQYGSSSTLFFPVRISSLTTLDASTMTVPNGPGTSRLPEVGNNDDDVDPWEVTKDFGIILYNYGLACLLLSIKQQQMARRQQGAAPTTAGNKTTNNVKKYLKRAQSSFRVSKISFLSALQMNSDIPYEDMVVVDRRYGADDICTFLLHYPFFMQLQHHQQQHQHQQLDVFQAEESKLVVLLICLSLNCESSMLLQYSRQGYLHGVFQMNQATVSSICSNLNTQNPKPLVSSSSSSSSLPSADEETNIPISNGTDSRSSMEVEPTSAHSSSSECMTSIFPVRAAARAA